MCLRVVTVDQILTTNNASKAEGNMWFILFRLEPVQFIDRWSVFVLNHIDSVSINYMYEGDVLQRDAYVTIITDLTFISVVNAISVNRHQYRK